MRPKASADDVNAALAAVARADFLPEEVRDLAGEDQALPLGYGQTNSQPHTVANMLRLLSAEPGHKILDVGAGSGWSTALLGHLVGSSGLVIGVELVPELTRQATRTLARYPMPWATIQQADADVLGDPGQAPYDRILVSAEAAEMPHQLIAQLKDGGVLVVPVAGEMLRIIKRGDDFDVSRHGPYRFVPLR